VLSAFRRLIGRGEKVASGPQLRPTDGQGPFTSHFSKWVPRKVEGDFYEVMREAVPYLDGGIDRLCDLEGHIRIVGDNAALVDEIKEWTYNVPVSGLNRGLQSFHKSLSNEAFEQGFALGEFVTDRKRKDITSLNVADSKTVKFRRGRSGGVDIYQKTEGDREERLLKPDNLMYFANNPENQNPYGTSILRSLEFTAKVFATIDNATANNWERWGEPSFHAHLKGAGRMDGTRLEEVRKKIAEDLDASARAKREGKSVDIVTAGTMGSELLIKVLGADGQTLEIEAPVRHVIENLLAKLGIPPWMLGLHWSTTGGMSDSEAEVFMAGVRTRQAAKGPLFYNLIRNLLLLRGRTWKKGDWGIEWVQVNLHDIYKQAQANFLNSQAAMMESTTQSWGEEPESDKTYRVKGVCNCHRGAKEMRRAEPWPEMDRLEREYEDRLKGDWKELEERVTVAVGLGERKSAKAPPGLPPIESFTFSEEQRARVYRALREFLGIYVIKDPDSPVSWYYGQAFSEGLIQAARMVGQDRPVLDIVRNRKTFERLRDEGFELVKNKATLHIREKIIPEMEAQALAGTNPRHVADTLRRRFGHANADWERLARTELSISGETAKVEEWKAQGVYTKGAVIAGKDTHPRCRCANSIKYVDDKPVVVFVPAPDACPICVAAAV
jgi:hypothetical protein